MLIYKITNKINGKVYIGQTTKTLRRRWTKHCIAAKTDNIPFHRALIKYGFENFTVEQIDVASSIEELNKKEVYWIKHYNSMMPNGYNVCEGGGGVSGFKFRPETIEKLKESHIGKKQTAETKKKISDSAKGLKHWGTKKLLCVETGEVFEYISLASEKYGISKSNIVQVCKGKRQTAGGLHWKYADEGGVFDETG